MTDDPNHDLSALGARVASANASARGRLDVEAVLARPRARRGPRGARALVAAAAAAAALIGVGTLGDRLLGDHLLGDRLLGEHLFGGRLLGGHLLGEGASTPGEPPASPREPAIGFEVDGVAGAVGAPIDGTVERALAFSDGSSVLGARGAVLRVTETHANGASVVVERGSVAASIRHRDATTWRFEAGPNVVEVTGTRFDLAWDPAGGRLGLTMHDGSVRVHGPGLPPRTLVAGQSLRWPEEDARTTSEPIGEPGDGDGRGASGALEERTNADPRAEDARAPGERGPRDRARSGQRASADDWAMLEARGEYEASYDAASHVGLTTLYAQLPAARLVRLGDVARFAGHPDDARAAYEAVRRRFAGSGTAARAAFALGVLARGSEAERHFEAYLREDPAGALEREAIGRLLEARHEAGDPSGAARWARRYLALDAEGPHAALARRVLAE